LQEHSSYSTGLLIGVDALQDFANDQVPKSSAAAADDEFEQFRLLGLRVAKEINPDCCINDRWHDVVPIGEELMSPRQWIRMCS
jgi:hypothetical protein